MKKLLLLIPFLLIGFSSISQETLTKNEFVELLEQMEGSYQIIVKNSRLKPEINSELLLKIKNAQRESQDTTIVFNDLISVIVFSKQNIQNNGPIDSDSKVIYIND